MIRRLALIFLFCSGLAAADLSSSRLNNDPNVVYLDDHLERPVKLGVTLDAKVFSDKNGNHRLGTLLKNQTVKVEAITDRAYRVRGQGSTGGIAGWVSPKAFESADPDFVENLKKVYERQLRIQELIRNNEVAIGMTTSEVSRSLGEPEKRSARQTAEGESGVWEFITYEEEKHYRYFRDRFTGQTVRQFSHVTLKETAKTTVEFENDLVTAIEQSEDPIGGKVRIVVPPITFHW